MNDDSPKTPDSDVHDSDNEVSEAAAPNATPSLSDQQATDEAEGSKSKLITKLRMVALGGAVFGMVFGAVVEMFVQGAMESTGWFGPTLDSVMEEQVANFEDIKAKLAQLSQTSDASERSTLQKELEALLKKQEDLTSQTHKELVQSKTETDSLRSESLEKSGTAKGADVWLATGQSINVGDRRNVFSLLRVDAYRRAHINLSGEAKVLSVGDYVEASVDGEPWRVFYRQGSRGDDLSHLGFDVVRPD